MTPVDTLAHDLSYVALPMPYHSSELTLDPKQSVLPGSEAHSFISASAPDMSSSTANSIWHQIASGASKGFPAESQRIMSLPPAVYSWSITIVTPETILRTYRIFYCH